MTTAKPDHSANPPPQIRCKWRMLSGTAYGSRQPVLLGAIRLPGIESLDLAMLDSILGGWFAGRTPLAAPSDSPPALVLVQRALHWASVLQESVGLPVFDSGRVLSRDGPDADPETIDVAMPYFHPQATVSAMSWSLSTLARLQTAGVELAKTVQQAASGLETLCGDLHKIALPGENIIKFLRAARDQDVPWRWLAGECFVLGHGARARWLDSTLTDATPSIGVYLARHKPSTARVLRQAGLPVPDHELAATAQAAVEIASRLGYPVVVKPADTDGGLGVAAGLRDAAAVTAAFQIARKQSSQILVEKHVEGQDHRLTISHGRMVKAIIRTPGGVTGDGVSTVTELLVRLNADPRRGRSNLFGLKTLDLDAEALAMLKEAGLSPQSVPEAGVFVPLRRRANVTSGGSTMLVTDRVHPDNRRLAERAAAALRLDLAGIDLLIPDISRSWLETGAAICEVNAKPQLGFALTPRLHGEVLTEIMGGDGRIPLVLVMGETLAEPVAQRVQAALTDRGLRVGRASSAGVWLGEERLAPGGATLPAAGQALLACREVEAAVLAATSAEVLADGLPFDRCAVMVHADAPTGDGSDRFARACRLALPHARDALVIDADDATCLAQSAEADDSIRLSLVTNRTGSATVAAHRPLADDADEQELRVIQLATATVMALQLPGPEES